MANYEISATLNIDNAKAKKAIKDTLTQIKDLEKGAKSYNDTSDKTSKSTDKLSKAVKDNDKAYRGLFSSTASHTKQLEKLTSGLGDNHKGNKQLMNDIERTHKSLIKENASVEKATKTWQKFGKQRGLAFSGNSLVSASNSLGLTKSLSKNLDTIKNRTSQIGNVSQKAFSDYTQKVGELNTKLNTGAITQANFNKGIRDVSNYMKGTYGVTVKQLGNGYSTLTSRTNDAKTALNQYTQALRTANNQVKNGTFDKSARQMLRAYRDNLGYITMGAEKYQNVLSRATTDKEGIKINTLKDITSHLYKYRNQLGLTEAQINTMTRANTKFKGATNAVGGSLADITNGTGNYNKLLTTTTRSQRMQNYAMQVAGLRYNALGTTLGFVGGMLGTQLVMGFASARIESVKFEQQAQQMFKTSKLNKQGIQNVTKAIKDYTRQNRKLNTQGLEYTVAQVTKLNNLSEEQAKKIIPVVADITNMMKINGRSQEDSILAVNDALDGQFKRLQEIGVGGKNMLKAYGWTGDVEDKMSLIGALEKIGKKKGWNDLTKDISTLDDAYNVLGNTLDDVITPAMVKITPVVVDVVQAFSGLISKLWDAPVAIQGVATAIAVLGTAFIRMKAEMLYARLIGSEFVARLTGLDAGMYGITRSIGAVNIAVREGAISFEEGARCLMDYHTAQIGATRSYREYTTLLNGLVQEEQALNIAMENATGTELARLEAQKASNLSRQADLHTMREIETQYARYVLATNNLTTAEKMQLGTIQKKFGLNDAEMAQIIMKNKLINEETGALEINRVAKALDIDLDEMSTAEKIKFNIAANASNVTKRRSASIDKAKAKALAGLVIEENAEVEAIMTDTLAQEINNESKALAERIYAGLTKAQQNNISVTEIEAIATEEYNTALAEKIALTEALGVSKSEQMPVTTALLAEEEIEAATITATNGAIAENAAIRGLANKGLKKWIANLGASIKKIVAEGAALAATTAEFLLLTPEGWAVTGALIAIGAATKALIGRQMELNAVFGKFEDASKNVSEKLTNLEEKLKKTKDTGKKKEIQEEINQYKKLQDTIDKTEAKREETYEKALSRARKSNKNMINHNNKRFGKKEEDFTGLEDAINEKEKINQMIGQFGDTMGVRNEKLNKIIDANKINEQKSGELTKDYAQAQLDVLDAMDKFDSEDFMTRIGAYWDNFWARLKMSWIEMLADNGGSVVEVIKKAPSIIGNAIKSAYDSYDYGDIASSILEQGKKMMDSINAWFDTIDWNDVTNKLEAFLIKVGQDIVSWVDANGGTIIETIISAFKLQQNLLGTLGLVLLEVIGSIGLILLGLLGNLETQIGEWIGSAIERQFIVWKAEIKTWCLSIEDQIKNSISSAWNKVVTTTTSWWERVKQTAKELANKIVDGFKEVLKLKDKLVQEIKKLCDYLTGGQLIKDAETKSGQLADKMTKEFAKKLGLSEETQKEISDINNDLKDGAKTLPHPAYMMGYAIYKAYKRGQGRNSPGHAAKETEAEMEDIGNAITNSIPTLTRLSKTAGEKVSNSFKVNGASDNLNLIQNNQDIIKSNNLASKNTVTQYGTMSDTVDQSFTEMSDNATTDMQTVANQNAEYLGKMNSDTKTHMTNINSTTTSKLHTMQSTTATATNAMTKAWGSMRSSIVNSASQIREQSYSKFNSLHKSIASFYRQIQSAKFNAGALVAGSPSRSVKFSTTKHSTNSGVAGYSRQADREYVKLLNGLSNHSATNEDVIKFYSKYPMKCIGDDCFAGMTQNHVNRQINYASKWKISDPKMYGIALPMDNTVGDFNNGNRPRITYGNFEEYLGALLNARGFRGTYQFYFNSKRSNQQVWDDVRCNCFDGAELIMEIARDMGLGDVSMVHGSYNGIRHVAAKVGGKIYDMTQFQNRGVFRGVPGVSFGGAGYQGRSIKWSPNNRYAGNTTNTTNNKRVNKVEVVITGNTFIGDKDFKNQMKDVAEDVFYDKMSDNPCIGY